MAYEQDGELLHEEKAEILERMSVPQKEEAERVLTNGEQIVAEMENNERFHEFQVPTGRYKIEDGGGSAGNVSVHNEAGELLFHDILYGPPFAPYEITVTIDETDTISFDGFDILLLTPFPKEFTATISSGIWEVGLDIEPGTYQIIPTMPGIATIELFSEEAEPRVYEVIGDDVEGATITLSLEEGDILRVTGMSGIMLEGVK